MNYIVFLLLLSGTTFGQDTLNLPLIVDGKDWDDEPLSGQYIQDIGWKATHKFDTVKAVFLRVSETSNEITLPHQVKGWVVRELKTYYGGIDPGYNPFYKQPEDEWFPTGRYLLWDKKTLIPSEDVWQHKIRKW